MDFDRRIYDQVLKQLGPLMLSRTAALSEAERKALFSCACRLLVDCDSD